MPFCEECGAPYEVGARFCEACGNRLEEGRVAPRYSSKRERVFPWRAIRIGGAAVLAVLIVALMISRLGPGPSPTRLLPGNALLYAEVTDVPGFVQEVNQFLQEVSHTTGKDIKAEFKREFRLQDIENLFKTLSQIRSVHLCVVDFAVPALEGGIGRLLLRGQDIEAWLPTMVLLVDFGPKGKIVELFEERFLPQLKDKLHQEFQLSRTEFRGHPFYELEMPGLSLFAMFFQGYFLLSPQRQFLEELLHKPREEEESLDEDPLFVKTRAFSPRRGALVYLNLTPLWPKLDSLLYIIPGQEGRKARRLLEEIRPQDLKTLTLGVDPSGDVIQLTGHIQIDPDNPLVRIIRGSPRDWRELVEVIPVGVDYVIFFAMDDPFRTWQEFTSLALRFEGIMGESNLRKSLKEMDEKMEGELGRVAKDFEKYLFSSIGHTPTFLFWTGGGGLLLRQENAGKAESFLRNLEKELQREPRFHIHKKSLSGLTIYFIDFIEEHRSYQCAYTLWVTIYLLVPQKDLNKSYKAWQRGRPFGKTQRSPLCLHFYQRLVRVLYL